MITVHFALARKKPGVGRSRSKEKSRSLAAPASAGGLGCPKGALVYSPAEQEKLVASSGSPEPLYLADWG